MGIMATTSTNEAPELTESAYTTAVTTSKHDITTRLKPTVPTDGGLSTIDATNFGVPIAISVMVVMVLCLVIVMSKKRRREARLRGVIHRSSMRAISGGVAMNINVYRNYANHQGRSHSVSIEQGVSSTLHSNEMYYPEPPPSYEDAINQPGMGGYDAGIVNMAYSPSVNNLSANEVDPPAYTENPTDTTMPPTTPTPSGDNQDCDSSDKDKDNKNKKTHSVTDVAGQVPKSDTRGHTSTTTDSGPSSQSSGPDNQGECEHL